MKTGEHQIQVAGVRICRACWPICERLLFAIPNGGKRDTITGKRLKDEGVIAGVWDLMLAVRRENTQGMIIEVKRPGREKEMNGGLTPDQIKWGSEMANQGWKLDICYSAQQIVDAVALYLRLDMSNKSNKKMRRKHINSSADIDRLLQEWRNFPTVEKSQPCESCRNGNGLIIRQTPYGALCARHFLSTTRCSRPGCERVAVDDFVINKEGLCRDHLFEEPPRERESPYRFSAIAEAQFY